MKLTKNKFVSRKGKGCCTESKDTTSKFVDHLATLYPVLSLHISHPVLFSFSEFISHNWALVWLSTPTHHICVLEQYFMLLLLI